MFSYGIGWIMLHKRVFGPHLGLWKRWRDNTFVLLARDLEDISEYHHSL